MTDITFLARRIMRRRVQAAHTWTGPGIEQTQRRVLQWLTTRGQRTRYGAGVLDNAPAHPPLYATADPAVFAATMPVAPYPAIRSAVMDMVNGRKDILWPGHCRRFAQSSGTSDGKSKYIPVTADSLKHNHYRGAGDAVAHYLDLYPDSRLFSGKAFILGGSFANELTLPPRVKVGDLSANLIDAINPLVNLWRVPSKKTALIQDWAQKLPRLVEESVNSNVTNISGVPSWFMTVLEKVIQQAGATTIHDVWPNLEVFFHGGISMEPYRDSYRALTDASHTMRYLENYNASEGFFALQDLRQPGAMLLLLDAGVYYEFIPPEHADDPRPPTLTAWQVQQGHTYALVVTAPNGLWRYPIGDTVRIISTDPLRIAIAGRTQHYINAFGEEVMVYNTDAALARTCAMTGAKVRDYHVAPVFAHDKKRGHHQWLIEWQQQPRDMQQFAALLDTNLQHENSDYQAKRAGTIFLDPLTVTTATPGLFDKWLLEKTGKIGGQRKIPRLANDRSLMQTMLALIPEND